MENIPFHKPCENNNLLKMLDTSNSNFHQIVQFAMLHNGHLDTSKVTST